MNQFRMRYEDTLFTISFISYLLGRSQVSIDIHNSSIVTLPMRPELTYVEGTSINVIKVDEELHGLKNIYR